MKNSKEDTTLDEAKLRKKPRTERFYVFDTYEEGAQTFGDRMLMLLHEGHSLILTKLDDYYRKKGSRTITRTQLPEYFEQAANSTVVKLYAYQEQANEYLKNTIVDFARQIHRVELIVVQIPRIILRKQAVDAFSQLRTKYEQLNVVFHAQLQPLLHQRRQHQEMLHPDIGHPKYTEQLTKLDNDERARHKKLLDKLNSVRSKLNSLATNLNFQSSRKMAEEVIKLYELSDSLLTVDEVTNGNDIPTELLEFANEPLAQYLTSRNSRKWPIVMNLLSDSVRQCSEYVSEKSTLFHLATEVASRTLQHEFRNQYEEFMAKVRDELDKISLEEEDWIGYWQDSIKKIKGIYSLQE